MDLRRIVLDRMNELGIGVGPLSEATGVNRQTLYDFVREPGERHGKVRRSNLNLDALAAVFVALDLEVLPTKQTTKKNP